MPTACFLSPHLDDAVFSAGGTMARFVDAGWRVTLVTVYTRSVPHPTGFALACQTDKGLAAGVDYMAVRRSEDANAAAAIGVSPGDVHWLDLPEAPHRGYRSASDLFAGVHGEDASAADAVESAARRFVGEADLVVTAAGIGNHVDHLHVLAAARVLTTAAVKPLVLWHDTPYVLRLPEPPPADIACDITAGLTRKLNGCAAYATQLDFQFGGEAVMRERMKCLTERFNAVRTGQPNVPLVPWVE